MSKLVANGMFNVTAAAEKGAKPQFVYWDECPSSFKFCAGKDGEEVYHIVYNTRNTASSKYSKIPYLCIVSHTKNSTYPSDDVANSVNPKWMNFQTMALFATDLMLARKILAEEIDVDSLTVRNVSAVSSDGNTTCTIDGETGQLEAYNAILSGTLMTKMFLIENESSFNEVFSSEDTGNYWIKIKLNKRITNINVCWWRYYMSVSGTTRYHAYSLYMDDLDANMEGAEVIIHLGPTQVYMDNGLPVQYKTVKYVDGSFQYEDVIEYLQYGGSIRLKYVNSLVHRESSGKGFYWIKVA